MINLTLLSLNVFTFSSLTPLYTVQNLYQPRSSTILNSCFYRYFTNIIFSKAERHQMIIKKDIFSHILSSAIIFSSEESENTGSKKIFKAQNFTSKNHFNNNDLIGISDLYIANCYFIQCQSKTYGGGIFVQQECSVTLHELIFDKCTAKDGGGGYICRRKNNTDKDGYFSDELLSSINVQYCCFQKCFTIDDGSKSGFGSGLILAGQNVKLFYASTTECAISDLNGNKIKARGAQFDIQSSEVSSQYLNITGGNSKYCGSIEYRFSQFGFFKFQTISNVECMFVVAFSKFHNPSINIEFCNLINNKLSDYEENAYTYPAMMKITQTSLIINNFIFLNNNFNSNGRIASCDGQTNSEDTRKEGQEIILNDCYSNSYPKYTDDFFKSYNCNFNFGSELTTNPIDQLNLGECKGNATVGTLLITNIFTPSSYFSKSDEFSKSSVFTQSKKFSNSDCFSNSKVFSDSDEFVYPVDKGDQSKTGNKLKPGAIAGIVVAAVAASAIVAIVAFFLIRKKLYQFPSEVNIETLNDSVNSTKNDNPIYNANAEDDPFKEDF